MNSAFLHALVILVFSLNVKAAVDANAIYSSDGSLASYSAVVDGVTAGSIVILSEQHGTVAHHQKQIRFLQALAQRGHRVSVAMEHFYYQKQADLEAYLNGTIYETEFLQRIGWKNTGLHFDNYRYQVLFPQTTGGQTISLKAPREITNKVFKKGLESLTDKEQLLLPPGFGLGNNLYYERIKEALGGDGGHGKPDMLNNLFAAQSIWDDTMAWLSTDYIRSHPDEVLVIIVGDFHAAYGGGLPDRIRNNFGFDNLTVISQINIRGLKSSEQDRAVNPHETYGPRADYIWVSDDRYPWEDQTANVLAGLGLY